LNSTLESWNFKSWQKTAVIDSFGCFEDQQVNRFSDEGLVFAHVTCFYKDNIQPKQLSSLELCSLNCVYWSQRIIGALWKMLITLYVESIKQVLWHRETRLVLIFPFSAAGT